MWIDSIIESYSGFKNYNKVFFIIIVVNLTIKLLFINF